MTPLQLMNWKSTALVSVVTVVVTWFRMSMPAPGPTSTTSVAAAPARTVLAASPDIVQQAARLEAQLHRQTEYRTPTRNPFRFVTPAPRAAVVVAPRVDVSPASPVEPPRPSVRLTGIATDVVDGAMVFTAIVNTSAGLQLVREGEMAGEYKVVKIEEESVELSAGDGSTLLLRLR
jgi:hypothetical protein